jgi:hypothetical protein
MFHPPSSSSSSSSAQLIPADDDHPSSVVSLPAATASAPVAELLPEPFHHLPIHCFLFPARPGRRSQLRNLVHALLTDVATKHTNIPLVFLPYLDQWLANDTTLLPAPLHAQLHSLADLAHASDRIHPSVACQFWTDLHRFITTWRPPIQSQLAPSPPRPARPTQRSSRRCKRLRRPPSSPTAPPTKRPRRSLSSAPVPPSPSLLTHFYSTIRGTVSRLGTIFTPAPPPPPPLRRGPSRAAKRSKP